MAENRTSASSPSREPHRPAAAEFDSAVKHGDGEHEQRRGRRREGSDSRSRLQEPEGDDTPEQESADQGEGSSLESFRGVGGAARGAVAIGQDLGP